ncbi:hypothetical protein [Sphingomonas aracearum]|nr:hypothetical protein [Sphingomonas aracearum]
MRTVIKSSFLWQFAFGFALGAAGLFALQPADAGLALEAPAAIAAVR